MKQIKTQTKPFLIAVTGGIGSGKSVATCALKNAGYNTISCDAVTAELYKTRKVKKILKSLFPSAVTGFFRLKIDKKQISTAVFHDKNKHAALTSAITPLVLEEVIRRANILGGTIFVEVPLLFECDYSEHFDKVIVIIRDKLERIKSVCVRSSLTAREVEARMKNQVNYDTLDLSSYTVIKNDGDTKSLTEKVLSAAKTLIGE